MKQLKYSKGKKNGNKGGPDQDAAKMRERLTLYHDVVIMPEGNAGLVRDMTIPFKKKHGANERKQHVPDGQLMQHIRLQKKRFMGVGDRKHVCGHAYQLRLAQARQRLIKESVPPIKPSVLIKPKDGRRQYIRDDPRLTEALNSMNHIKRAQEPHDKNINPLFSPWVSKSVDEITLIQIDSENETEIDNEPEPPLSKKVSLSNFLARPGLLGNDSGAESDYEKDGTLLIPKEEERSEDSEAEDGYCHPDNRGKNTTRNPRQHRPETCETSTQVEAADTAADSSDSPSDDDEHPNVEAVKTARNLVVFNSTQQLFEDTGVSTALLQALAKSRFKFKTAEGITKTCGEDFLDIDIPKDAKVRSIRAKKKGTGKKSAPGHISAQERDPEVLVLEISDEENEILKDPAASRDENTAGPSGLTEDKIRGRKKENEKVVAPPQRSDGSERPKRRSSPRYQWIKFYHSENTKAFKQAKELQAPANKKSLQ